MSAVPSPRTIQRLRSEIETIDRSIVLLLGARERAQHRLLAWKEAAGIPGHDPAQEHRVLTRAIGWARECGTDEHVAAEVIRLALVSGKRRFAAAPVGSRTASRTAPARGGAPVSAGPPLLVRVNSG